MSDEKMVYTVKEVAVILGVSEQKIRQMVSDGILRRVPHISNIRIPKEDVLKLIKGGERFYG